MNFLGTRMTEDVCWTADSTVSEKVKKKNTQTHNHPKNNLDEVLLPFYQSESALRLIVEILSSKEKDSAENNKECSEHHCLLSALSGRH